MPGCGELTPLAAKFVVRLATVVLTMEVTRVSAGPLRDFQVRDSVEMSYFGTVASSAPDDLDDDGVLSITAFITRFR